MNEDKNNIWHLFPLQDNYGHRLDKDALVCECIPKVDIQSNGAILIVHNVMNRRFPSESIKTLTSDFQIAKTSYTYLEIPYRSPLVVVETVKDIVFDKTLCDVGCSCGDLMIEFKGYAKNVCGIEEEESRYLVAKNRGLDVILGDASQIVLPKTDIYYIWVGSDRIKPIVDNIQKGIIIIGAGIVAVGE